MGVFFRLVIHKVIHIVKIPRLIQDRHGTYYFRLVVPQGARLLVGKKEIRKTLHTKNRFLAGQMALALNIWINELMTKPKLSDFNFEEVKKLDVIVEGGKVTFRDIKTDEDVIRVQKITSGLAQLKPAFENSTAQETSEPFNTLTRQYLEELPLINAESTIDSKETCYLDFQVIFSNPLIHTISKDTATTYKQRQLANGLERQTINTKISFLLNFFEWAINHNKYFQPNPFMNLRIKANNKSGSVQKSYKSFTTDDLKNIFKPQNFIGYMGKKPDYYWLPIVCLYTGARIEEVASLKISDFNSEDGITYFIPNTAKTKSSIRKIPICDQLKTLGFLNYVEEIRALKQEQLFFYLNTSINGYSKNCSRRFGDYLTKIGIIDDRKVFHSLRHTVIDILTNQNTNTGLAMGLVGHIEQDKLQADINVSSPHFREYKHSKLHAIKSIADSLDFSFVFIGYVPYQPATLWVNVLKPNIKQKLKQPTPTKAKKTAT